MLRALGRYLRAVRAQTELPEQSARVLDCSERELHARWRAFADAEAGGRSSASLEHRAVPANALSVPCIALSGFLSVELSGGAPSASSRAPSKVGFAGMRTLESPSSRYLSCADSDTLSLSVRGDGRTYIVSLKTDSYIKPPPSNLDLWQAPLHTRTRAADEPFDLEHLPFSRFLLTHKGKVLDASASLEPSRITSFSVGLAGAGDLEPPGPFCLELAGVFAHESARGPLSLDVLPHPPAALSASSASSVEQPARATRMRDR
jgi:hypothetical protein